MAPVAIAYTAGLLHDIGKAQLFYWLNCGCYLIINNLEFTMKEEW